MSGEQKIRAFLFYLSVLIFLAGLPLILSSALGFKFDTRSFKFTKTGLIALKTQPAGANIYFENSLLKDKTPATITELLPGIYRLRIALDQYYPWSQEVRVDAGKVTRLEKIILFPRRPNIKQVNKEKFLFFWPDLEKGNIYYVDKEENSIYRSDLSGDNYERIADFLSIDPAPVKFLLSADRKKLAYFNRYEIALIYLEPASERPLVAVQFILEPSAGTIEDLFWHSDNYHLILVSDRAIEVLEAKSGSLPLKLVTLNRKNPAAYYDIRSDALYFLDSQKAQDGRVYENIYKLELGNRLLPFQELIKTRPAKMLDE